MAVSKNYGVLGKFGKAYKSVDIKINMGGIKWAEVEGFPGYEISNKGTIIDPNGDLVLPNDKGRVRLRDQDGKIYIRAVEALIDKAFPKPKKIKQVVVTDLEGNVVGIYDNRFQAGKAVGVTPQQVGCVVNGRSKSSKGYVFSEVEMEKI